MNRRFIINDALAIFEDFGIYCYSNMGSLHWLFLFVCFTVKRPQEGKKNYLGDLAESYFEMQISDPHRSDKMVTLDIIIKWLCLDIFEDRVNV